MFLGKYDHLNFSECGEGKTKHAGKCLVPNKHYPSTKKDKKRMVLVKKGDKTKLVHYGQKGYRHNYSKDAKKSYLARSGGIRNKSGELTKNDPFSPNYHARRQLWPQNKKADGKAKFSFEPSSLIEFAKKEKEVKVSAYRTRKGRVVNPFRRKQEVGTETTVKPSNLKALGIQAGIITAALAVPLIPIGVQAARGKMSDIRIKRYQKAATKALPAPTLGKGAYGSVQDISESQVGKVLQPYEPIANTPRPIREIVTGRDKEFEILKQLESTGVTPKPGKKNRFGFTMEKIEGEPLASFLKNTLQDPSEEQLQSIGQKLGEAVSKVHGAGVLHADLHTNNVFVSNKGEIKIIDFGEAVRIDKLKDKSKLPTYKEQDLEKVASNVGSFLNRDAFTRDERKAAERKLAVFRESLFLGYGKND
jgi:predicted Ser/Thr protein kinase